MLSVDEQGDVFHVNPTLAPSIQVPHRREVLAALRQIHREAGKRSTQVTKNLDTVCRFFGLTVPQMLQTPPTTAKE